MTATFPVASPRDWLIASALPLSSRHLHWLYRYYGGLPPVLQAPASDLTALGVPEAAVRALEAHRQSPARSPLARQADDILARLDTGNIALITRDDADYPALLEEIADPPPVLYLRGRREVLACPAMAMVGSRHATAGGLETARQLAGELAGAGFCVVSGLALGVDGAAHRGALDAGGLTLAVLGTGVDVLYPRAHARLAAQVMEQGALLSEMPLGEPPRRQHFPRRNRIVSGLSLGTLVVEAAERSGSLITAHYALEQGREVFAVPGSIRSPVSRGCHLLLRQGATLVESLDDLLAPLGGWTGRPAPAPGGEVPRPVLSDQERRLLEAVGFEPTPVDQVVARAALPAGDVAAGLIHLELKGLVHSGPGGVERVA